MIQKDWWLFLYMVGIPCSAFLLVFLVVCAVEYYLDQHRKSMEQRENTDIPQEAIVEETLGPKTTIVDPPVQPQQEAKPAAAATLDVTKCKCNQENCAFSENMTIILKSLQALSVYHVGVRASKYPNEEMDLSLRYVLRKINYATDMIGMNEEFYLLECGKRINDEENAKRKREDTTTDSSA